MKKKSGNKHATHLGPDRFTSSQVCINSDILEAILLHLNF